MALGMISLWFGTSEYRDDTKDKIKSIIDKIDQAIADKEFEEKRLQF
jgi:hypothetical protein